MISVIYLISLKNLTREKCLSSRCKKVCDKWSWGRKTMQHVKLEIVRGFSVFTIID